jgi:Zn-dependent protease
MDLRPEEIRGILIRVFVLIASVAFHEFGHALMADRLGDDTPRRQGRVTLNPIAHIDPIGTLLLPLLGGYTAARGGIGGFGWGKPVQWSPPRVSRKIRMATAQILVSVAGPAMNIVLAVLVATAHAILLWRGVVTPGSEVNGIFVIAVNINFILFFFNLVPVPPLDGGHVLEGLMPYRYRAQYESFARYGYVVVAALAMIPTLALIFVIPARFCTEHLYGLLAHVFGM